MTLAFEISVGSSATELVKRVHCAANHPGAHVHALHAEYWCIGRRVKVSEHAFVRVGPIGWAVALAALAIVCQVLGTGEQLAFIYYQF